MDRVQVFLRSRLFTTREDGHVPSRAVILEGQVIEMQGSAIKITVDTWRNDQGKQIDGENKTLFIPQSKIDHIWILD